MILKGKKVILRPIQLTDAERFVKWFNDPEVNKFLAVKGMNLKDERKWIKDRMSGKVAKDQIFFCIDTKEGMHIGSTSLNIVSKRAKQGHFGIMIGDKDYWNSGYGSEAAKLIIDYGFKKLKLHRVDLDVYDYNQRAIKVYKRLGFKVEGKKREANFYNGKFYDSYLMGILSREWKNLKFRK